MFSADSLRELPIFQNSLTTWLIAIFVSVVSFMLLATIRAAIRKSYARYKATQHVEVLEIPLQVLSRTSVLFFVVLAMFAGFQTLTTGSTSQNISNKAITIALFWQMGLWAVSAATAWLTHKRARSLSSDKIVAGSIGIIGFIVNAVIWALVVLLTLDNLGVNITALVAGLGIGGVAVALALQNILGDLFASLSIALDRPFVLGDFLIIDDFMGSVEYVGIKSTRIRSLSGEQIILSNGDLLKSRVRNYGRMQERRVVFATTLTYETPIDVIEKIPAAIRTIVEAQDGTRFDRSHFQKHGSASLDFETVYYILSADYNRYMDVQQQINLALHRKIAELGAEFAYPTQRLLLEDTKSTDPNHNEPRRTATVPHGDSRTTMR